MKVLFIGGTGVISSACSALAVERGIELYLLNRGASIRPVPERAHHLIADINDPSAVRRILADHRFDAVVDWIAFRPQQIDVDIQLFREITSQFVFISSASAYQTPPALLPVTESTVLDNPFWEYSRDKIACEERLVRAYREEKFPFTIVRPSHTYDRTLLPFEGHWTVVDRMRRGKPVIVHGDGTSLWTLTHHMDFARGFTGLLGNSHAIGEAVHITSDEWLNWNQIFQIVGHVAGVEPQLIHVPSEIINRFDAGWGASLLGDKSVSMIFDNSKIKRLVPGFHAEIPFSRGSSEIIAWFDEDPARKSVDAKFDQTCDRIVAFYRKNMQGLTE